MQETVFRFQCIRDADPPGQDGTTISSRVDPWRGIGHLGLRTRLEDAATAGVSLKEMQRLASAYLDQGGGIGSVDELDFEVDVFLAWAARHTDTPLSNIDLKAELEVLCDGPISEFLTRDEVIEGSRRLADTLLAGSILRSASDLARVTQVTKLLHLLREVDEDRSPRQGDLALGEALDRMIVALPRATAPPPPGTVAPSPPVADLDTSSKQLAKLDDLDIAYRHLIELLRRPGAVVLESTGDYGTEMRKQVSETHEYSQSEVDLVGAGPPSDPEDPTVRHRAVPQLVLSRSALATMPETAREIIGKLMRENASLNPFALVNALEGEMDEIAADLSTKMRPPLKIRVGDTWLDADAMASVFGWQAYASVGADTELPEGSEFLPSPSEVRCQYRAYVDDLLIVKQSLEAYELAEFAHVENVMAGETRSREHRRLNLSEQITTMETEREAETERDLQSTDRNEIQTEAENKIKQDSKLEAGLRVSGSYGPTISFQADTKGSFSNTTEENRRKAVSYAREVTEKSSERTRERVREERKRRILQEIEETNTHSFVGPPDRHVRGVYRWLNKKYKAQIFEYGQRMMLELILPEPAAFYLYALVENPPSELAAPQPPKFEGAPLKPENISRKNYQDYVAAYQVRAVPPPPSAFIMKSVFEKQDGTTSGCYGRATKVTIPPEYEAIAAQVSSHHSRLESIGKDNKDSVVVMVADQTYQMRDAWKGLYMSFAYPNPLAWRGEISVGFSAINVWSFAISVDIMCNLTEIGMKKWQQEVYEAIMEAYLALKSEYDERQTAESIGGVSFGGRNPLENRQIEKEELKKLIVMALMNDPLLDMGAFRAGNEPVFDPILACANEPWIRFFEQAFEWHNMLYVFYPYFWGRRARWRTLMNVTDTDRDFAAFLKAGAVRVQLPVRPEFTRIVGKFCQTGEFPSADDETIFSDDLYLPIIEEITAKLGKPGDEKPYSKDPDPWEVTVPTTLVVVQDLSEIPGIRDTLTDTDITLTSEGD